MIVTYIGMASIFLGFLCVMGPSGSSTIVKIAAGPSCWGFWPFFSSPSFRRLLLCFRRNDHWLDFFSPVICGTVVGCLTQRTLLLHPQR